MIYPVGNLGIRFIERNEIMLPNAFLLEAPKKSLNHAVLFRRVWRNILLMNPIFRHCFIKSLGLEHKAIVGLCWAL